MRRRRKTKILATLGPASNNPAMMRTLFDAGVDIFRINMSHTNHDMLKQMHGAIRALSEEMGSHIGILCDLQGPKIRLGTIPGGKRMLVEGEKIRLVLGETAKDPEEIPIPHPEIFQAIKQKHALLIDDGKVRLRLLRKADTFAEAIVEVAGEIKDRKGVNMPDTLLPMSAMTPKDRADLDAVEPLTERHHPEQHADQRGNEVPERGVDDVVGVHRPDVDEPVGRDQYRGHGEQQPGAGGDTPQVTEAPHRHQ
jgi:pyruvate kinase